MAVRTGSNGESFVVDYSTRYKKGQYSFTNDDLFDRVINLKLFAGKNVSDESGIQTVQDEFVIRSDYEIYDRNFLKGLFSDKAAGSESYMRKCRMKPSIKVQYKQVAQGTAIQIDIFVSNFFVFTKDGKALMQFNADTYPLSKVEVQMGYFGQFSQPYARSGGVPTFSEFFEMRAPPTVQVLYCTVDYVQTDKLPPDATLHIHGFVANSYGTSVAGNTQTKVIAFDTPVQADPLYVKSIPHWLYNFVTRRFLRSNVLPQNALLKVDSAGYMQSKDADDYGVHVYVSQGLLTHASSVVKQVTDSKGKIKEYPFYTQAGIADTVVRTLNNLKSFIGSDYRLKMLLNGDYLFYTREESQDPSRLSAKDGIKWYIYSPELGNKGVSGLPEDDKKALESVGSQSVGLKQVTWNEIMSATGSAEETDVWVSSVSRENILPAVYNITTDALCTIVCPYFFFINPFDTVRFRSRYSLGGIVSYFANFTAAEDEFTILWQNVSFATVEDVNECQMVATGRRQR